METKYHIPVLLKESVDGLDVKAGGVYVDVTFGGGGHSGEILKTFGDCQNVVQGTGHLYSFDQDADAAGNAERLEKEAGQMFTFVRSNFRYLKNFMRYYGHMQVDGILADLGVSSHHFDEGERGFSFREDAPLDMRMNQNAGLTAKDVVNKYSEEQLADVLYMYGELKNSRKLASQIVKARPIETTGQLAACVEKGSRGQEYKGSRGGSDLAQVFQAIRIEVNHEMDALREMLNAATEILKPRGRLVVITYHSLEDRMVKNIMRTGNIEGKENKDFYGRVSTPYRLVNKKVITPSDEEIEKNPRSRSAKLRIAEKI